MALTSEDLLAISQLLDSKLEPIKEDISTMQEDINSMQEDIKNMDSRIDSVESQVKQTERVLKNEIRNSEGLILDEVERVHTILERHQNDNSKHIA